MAAENRRPRRRLGALAVAVALVAAGVAGGAWWLLRPDPGDAPSDEVATGDDGAELDEAVGEPLTYEQDREAADRAAALLTGLGDDADVGDATASGTLDELDAGEVEGALPPGARVEAQPDTWVRRGNVAAMAVEVAPEGGEEVDRFMVSLVRRGDGDWAISSTQLLTGAEGDAP